MKRISLFILIILAPAFCVSQNKLRLPIWTFQGKNARIIGLAAGLNYTRKIENVRVYGVSFELFGLGGLSFMLPRVPVSADSSEFRSRDTVQVAIQVNGINISPLGSICKCDLNGINLGIIGGVAHRSNGVSIVLLQNFSEYANGLHLALTYNGVAVMNGLQIALVANLTTISSSGVQIAITNTAKKHRGLQIGLYNKAEDLKGLQIGLWNVNSKRSLPLINW